METINFNDFSFKERHEIITAFLIKMRKANSMQSAHSFFDYYLKHFYKMPIQLRDDIVYCQRAMKSYLSVHQTITKVFTGKSDKDPESMKNFLLDIENVLHEINAECQYLMICMEDDIERFCLPFTEQKLQANGILINEMVSETVVPLITASILSLKPNFVAERPTESQLMRKFFTACTQAKKMLSSNQDKKTKSTKSTAPKKTNVSAPEKATSKASKSSKSPLKTPCKNYVSASRLNLQAALNRAHLNNKNQKLDNKADSPKQMFLNYFGLCTHLEHKRKILTQTLAQKRRPKHIKK